MPDQQIANYVQTQLALAATNVALTFTLVSVAGLPTVGPFRLRIDDPAPATTFEILEVATVNVGANTVTCAALGNRGLEGTTAIAHPAGAFVGNEITAAMLLASFARGQLSGGYAQVVAVQGGITAEVDLTSLTVTVTTLPGRRVKITGYALFTDTVAADQVALSIKEGATYLTNTIMPSVTTNNVAIVSIAVIAPTAAAHTYILRMGRATGTGTITMQANVNNPAFILVEDVGAV